MHDISTVLAQLQLRIATNPALQARLFEINDNEEFITIVSHLATEEGFHDITEMIREIMQQSRRDWVERNLP